MEGSWYLRPNLRTRVNGSLRICPGSENARSSHTEAALRIAQQWRSGPDLLLAQIPPGRTIAFFHAIILRLCNWLMLYYKDRGLERYNDFGTNRRSDDRSYRPVRAHYVPDRAPRFTARGDRAGNSLRLATLKTVGEVQEVVVRSWVTQLCLGSPADFDVSA